MLKNDINLLFPSENISLTPIFSIFSSQAIFFLKRKKIKKNHHLLLFIKKINQYIDIILKFEPV